MRNVSISAVDATPRDVIAIATEYAKGFHLPSHQHRRAQLLYGASGVMHVSTPAGTWVVPPQRAVWIPPQVAHEVLFVGVTTHSLYIEPAAVAAMAPRCRVLEVSGFLRALLLEAVEVPLEYAASGRDATLMQLLVEEISRAAEMALHIPMPGQPRLLGQCQGFLLSPDIRVDSQQWADSMFISLRTFNRLFRQQTGLSFGQWRQQACAVLALSRLAQGQSVTRIALDMGYESPAAFATMFRRVVGQPPSVYLKV